MPKPDRIRVVRRIGKRLVHQKTYKVAPWDNSEWIAFIIVGVILLFYLIIASCVAVIK